MNKFDLTAVFNCGDLLVKEAELDLGPAVQGHIPLIDPGYVFERGALDALLLYLVHPFKDCLYLSGPAGCGKTSLVHQAAARLNWGVEQITLSNKSESLDLIGHQTLKHGQLVFEYGPLASAMIYGEILILNEIDLVAPGDLAALNDVLEGKPLTVVGNNGEIIYPHQSFRVVATANSRGSGDSSGFYSGARILNQAFLDRFRFVQVDYPSANVEKLMLSENFPALSGELTDRLTRFAAELRRVLKNGAEAGVSQLTAPFSSRTLLRIGSMLNLGLGISVQQAVDTCYALRLPEVEREYVQRLCNDVFGHEHPEERSADRAHSGQAPEQSPAA